MNLPDYENRRLAVSTFDKNIVVTAGAGTGKTTLLVDRIVCLLMRPHDPLKITDIVALTFTNKAAGEMRSRLRKKLEGIIAKDINLAKDDKNSPPFFKGGQGGVFSGENRMLSEIFEDFKLTDIEIRKRANNALSEIEKAQICTMHSFAGYVLRLYPVEAGIDPGFKEDDGTAFEEHFEREWEDWLDTELSHTPPHRELWEEILDKTTVASLKEFVRELCKETIPLNSLVISHEPGFTKGDENERDKNVPPIVNINPDRRGFLTPPDDFRINQDTDPAFISWLESNNLRIRELLTKYTEQRPKLRKVEKLILASEEVFENVISGVTPDIMYDDTSTKPADWYEYDYDDAVRIIKSAKRLSAADDVFFSRVMELCVPFARRCRERFTASGYISFDGLLSFCREILKNRKEVRGDIKNRFKAILVDEFQDTDPVQYEIVLYMAEVSGQHETDWRKVKLTPGKLFIVGDPKQSIYSFRKADIEAYSQVRDMVLSDNPGSKTDLLTNFRSNNRIIDVVNGLFSQLIKKRGLYQPEYVRLVNRADNEAFLSDQKVELRLIEAGDAEDVNAQKAVRLEAEAIGRWIKEEAVDKKEVPGPDGKKMLVSYRHIAILLRKLTDVNNYIEVLRKYDIPYTVEGEKHFYSTQEVIDFVNLLRVIDNPADSLAMAGVLRSPLGGLSDKEIYELNRLSMLDYRSAVFPTLEKEGQRGLSKLFELLSLLKKEAGAMPVPDAIHFIFDTLPVLEFAASSYNGEQAVANLLKIQKIAESQSDRGDLTLKGFTALLEENITQLQEEGESLLSEEAVNAVRILSIHRAKGLEFPVVILAGTHSYPNVREDNISVVHDWSTCTTGFKLNNMRNRASVMYYDKNTLKDEEEQKRLLYVAMTRARESLIISGTRYGKLNKNCFLEMIREVAGDFMSEGDSGEILLSDGKINQTIIKYDALNKGKTSAGRKVEDVTGKNAAFAGHVPIEISEIAGQWNVRTNHYNEMLGKTMFVTPTIMSHRVTKEDENHPPIPPLSKGELWGVFSDEHRLFSGERSLLIGTVIHHILEQWDFKNNRLMNDAALEDVIEMLIPIDTGDNMSDIKDEITGIMNSFFSSDLYNELKRVEIIGREVPFTMLWGDQIIEGVIDLIYKDGDTVYIADYKTDRVQEIPDIPPLEKGGQGGFETLIAGKYSVSGKIYIEAVKRCLCIEAGGFNLIFLRSAKSVLIKGSTGISVGTCPASRNRTR